MFSNLVKIVFITIFIVSCSCDEVGPSISAISPQQIKDIGDTVQLNCTIKDGSDFAIVWNKKYRDRPTDSVTLATGTTLLIREPRFRFTVNNETNTYTLQIKDIEPLDTGIYECQIIISTNEKQSQHVELLVRQPPIISDNLTTLSVESTIGETVNLACVADGYPKPTITWKREYNAILPIGGHLYSGNTLKITNIQKQDRGTYYCQASNGVGKTDTKHINLEVEFEPDISVPRPKVAQALNYDIELECIVAAYPSPSVLWKKNGKQLMDSDDYRITQIASVDKVTKTTLRIISLEEFQFGDYYCEASNKLGNTEKRLNLFQATVPDINYRGWILNSSSSINIHFILLITTNILILIINF